jgi:hypothetical protein
VAKSASCEPLSGQKTFASCGGHFRGTATKVGIQVFFLDFCLRRKDTSPPPASPAVGRGGLESNPRP